MRGPWRPTAQHHLLPSVVPACCRRRRNNIIRIRMVRASCLLASCVLIALLLVVPASAYPRYPSNYYRDDVQYEPEEIMDMLNRLGNLIQIERKMENYKDDITSEKRALDLGLSRGYSGTLQAKHLMGLAAANYAGGPGRRRRDAH
ncbi:unnamed protein product [Arctia plantaginis]|uniref:Diuretic hormone class 2 n=1 Tax=Arctia plantaginis TaxID=874455 RepID=A0A8S0Z4U2_ARCPL|nr:unnamed protein product [Arctia plantaginis]